MAGRAAGVTKPTEGMEQADLGVAGTASLSTCDLKASWFPAPTASGDPGLRRRQSPPFKAALKIGCAKFKTEFSRKPLKKKNWFKNRE